MNNDRAAWAEEALSKFQQTTRCDREDALPDLLANMMHWCDREKVDFHIALRKAQDHYREETRG
jgi:hypothetical protein